MDVKGKYLKDENGEIISPITSMNTVFDNDGNSLNSIIAKDAYFYSVLSRQQNIDNNSKQIIQFTSYDNSLNINLNISTYTFTVQYAGIYLINLYCHFGAKTEVTSNIPYRLLIECNISNNDQSLSLSKYRGQDVEKKLFGGDCSLNNNWIMCLNSNAGLQFTAYPLGDSGVLRSSQDTTDTDGTRATYVFIKKIGNYI